MTRAIIKEAFIEYINDEFKVSRKKAKESGRDILDNNYWIQGTLIKIEGIDINGNIVYKEKKSGTETILSVRAHYDEYKPYHDRWMIIKKRNKKLKELGL